jgi:hypothetical protein
VSRSHARLVALLLLFIALALVGSRAGTWVMSELSFHLSPRTEPLLHRLIMIATAIYIVLMALPFCPGIEIGLGLIVLFGADIVPLVYLSTIGALLLAFLVGRLVPPAMIIDAFDALRLHRARDLLRRMEPLDSKQRLDLLQGSSTRRLFRGVLRYRYLAVAVALNTPGNIVIGDGGGIALAAGFSRLFSFPAFALTVILAVSPVPAAILFTEWVRS